jgi:serine protease
MNGNAQHRSRGIVAALVFVVASLLAAPAHAAQVEAIVVKFRGDAALAGVDALPDGHRFLAIKALRTGVAEIGRTRDGAYRLALEPALPFLEAQEAINRLRLDAQVLYVHGASRVAADPRVRVPPKSGAPEPLLHRIAVKYRDANTIAAAARELPLAQGKLDRIAALAGTAVAHERVMSGDAYVVRLFSRMPRVALEAITDALEQDPDVEWAQPDYLDRIALVPNDPSYASQWHYFDPVGGANLPNAWNRTTGSASIRVAVVDTGSLPNHPDLTGVFVGGYDTILESLTANDNDPPCGTHPTSPCYNSRDADAADPGDWVTSAEDLSGWFQGCGARNSSWHGTHVAGTIAALTNNGVGVSGVNWVSKVVPVRALGKCGGYSTDIADAITWGSGGSVPGLPANANPAQVVNMSLGGYRANATCDAVYQTAINGALARNAVVVVAAGNANQEAKFHTPANCNGVITVAANGRLGQRASYSNYDNNEAGVQVEIAAPGGSDGQSVLSTLNSGTTTPSPAGYIYTGYNGTSMATPHVAGIVSLMLSVAPTKTPAQILAAIQTTARAFPTGTGRDCTSNVANVTSAVKYCGAGIIDADAAIAAVQGGLSTTVLASAPNPSVPGQNVTFTATVTGNAPTGTVAFTVNTITIPGCGAVPLAGTGNARAAQCATPNLPVGSFSIGAAYSGDANNASSAATPVTHAVLSLAALSKQRDFNGDFRADLLWRANAGGTYGIWLMNGTTATVVAGIGLAAPWQVTHTADFSGDGRHDLLLRNATTGTTSLWLMNGVAFTSVATLLADPNWTATHTGDFNGDGRADIVWRHAPTGTTAMWLMNGTTFAGGGTLLVSTAWQVVFTGDFDGDGKDDLLWRNASTGETAIWLMNGASFTSGTVILASTAWAPTHTGDFNGDGRTDIVWRNTTTGQTALWMMNGLFMAGGSILVSDPNWTVIRAADLNGDGQDDLLWRYTPTGAVNAWLMSAGGYVSGATITLAGSGVVATGDYNGDGRADIVWNNAATGATEIRLMNGLAVGSAAVVLTSTDWNVQP